MATRHRKTAHKLDNELQHKYQNTGRASAELQIADWSGMLDALGAVKSDYWHRKIMYCSLTICPPYFYISLTVHLGIILVNNELDALFQCIYLFHFSTCFEQPSAHHQENQSYQYIIWYVSMCVGECLVCQSGGTGIQDSHLQTVIHTRWCIDTIDSPDDEHWVARNT
jgi:hypothetical protein